MLSGVRNKGHPGRQRSPGGGGEADESGPGGESCRGFLSQYSAIATQAAELKADRQGLRQSLPEVRQLLQELKDAMIAAFGRSSPEIQKFGLRGRTARKLTSEQRALAAEKARRTRALRGTKGSRQKAAIRFAGQPTLVLGPGETPAETSPAAVAAKPPVA